MVHIGLAYVVKMPYKAYVYYTWGCIWSICVGL